MLRIIVVLQDMACAVVNEEMPSRFLFNTAKASLRAGIKPGLKSGV